MATDKMFSCAGVSILNGKAKVRYANSMQRIKTLLQNGHTDIEFVDFGEPWRKEDLVDKLLDHQFANPDFGNVVKEEAREFGFLVD